MSDEPRIENGFASVPGGTWLVRRGQPAASHGSVRVKGLKGLFAPDRRVLQLAETEGSLHLSSAARPFLTELAVTDDMKAVSSKILVTPAAARKGGRLVRVIPMSFRHAFAVTDLVAGFWSVFATRSRVKRLVLDENDIATVRVESVVAWTGKEPTGFCPKLRLRDLILPVRRGTSLALNFYGPQIVWVEGCDEF